MHATRADQVGMCSMWTTQIKMDAASRVSTTSTNTGTAGCVLSLCNICMHVGVCVCGWGGVFSLTVCVSVQACRYVCVCVCGWGGVFSLTVCVSVQACSYVCVCVCVCVRERERERERGGGAGRKKEM